MVNKNRILNKLVILMNKFIQDMRKYQWSDDPIYRNTCVKAKKRDFWLDIQRVALWIDEKKNRILIREGNCK